MTAQHEAALFEQLIGVSRAELERRRIDPDAFALKHIHQELRRAAGRSSIPRTVHCQRAASAWLSRMYASLLIGILFLWLSLPEPVRPLAIVGLVVSVMSAGYCWAESARAQRTAAAAAR